MSRGGILGLKIRSEMMEDAIQGNEFEPNDQQVGVAWANRVSCTVVAVGQCRIGITSTRFRLVVGLVVHR